jgi:hypothetical protein
MLFTRIIPPSCSYCLHGADIGGGEIACVKRGISTAGSFCGKFAYDPLKREPERPKNPAKISEEMSPEDFEI